jgi:predicted transcriptional regulator
MLTEFWEDYYSSNKSEMYELNAPFDTLGDPLVDKWERQVRSGQVPDLMEGLNDNEAEELIEWSRKAYKKKVRRGIIRGVSDSGIGVGNHDIEELLGEDDSFEETF